MTLEDDLRSEFLPRFLAAARSRLEQARIGSFHELAGELHALAGEAMLLGLPEVSSLALEGERAAQRSFENASSEARAACVDALRRLIDMVERLSQSVGRPAS
jgi:hypothetical protein